MNSMESILNKLNSDGALFRCQGIIEAVRCDDPDDAIVERLKELKTDDILVMGRPVSAYAVAALDLLQKEQYDGSDRDVSDLIKGIPEIKHIMKDSNLSEDQQKRIDAIMKKWHEEIDKILETPEDYYNGGLSCHKATERQKPYEALRDKYMTMIQRIKEENNDKGN